jgi:hypothetical protein
VLVVDAFSSDSIPAHLITVEAIELYLRHLRDDDGVIALHISNRYLDLDPLARGLAQRLGLTVLRIDDAESNDMVYSSDWMLLARDPAALAASELQVPAEPEPEQTGPWPLWTDAYSNLPMIRLDNISKQNGHQILFIEASAAIQKGREGRPRRPERRRQDDAVPHDHAAGEPDDGQVMIDRGITLGYFSQDVGEMRAAARSPRSWTARARSPRSPPSSPARARHRRSRPTPTSWTPSSRAIGEVQARFEELDGYALEGRAREVLAGLGFARSRWTATSARCPAAGRCAWRSPASC